MVKKSLVSEASTKTAVATQSDAPQLPIMFTPQTAAVPDVAAPLVARNTYVQFAHPKAKNYADILRAIPDVQEGDPVLIYGDGRKPLKLSPCRFYLIHAHQHFAKLNNVGDVVESTTDVEEARKSRDWKECIETVILVVTLDELVPATCNFKTTKAGAAHDAIKALKLASSPQWAKESPEHEASMVATDPRFRFTVTLSLTSATGKSSGNKYVAANGKSHPTGVADWKRIGAFFADAANAKRCADTAEAFNRRVAELKTKEK